MASTPSTTCIALRDDAVIVRPRARPDPARFESARLGWLPGLKRIKSRSLSADIPVVILTTSNREEDILQTYQAGANTYISKPDEYPRYRELVATLEHYWVDTALKVPRHLMRSLVKGSEPV